MNQDNDPIHCHKCKRRTLNINSKIVQTTNGLWRIAAQCKVCNTNKSKFIKTPNQPAIEKVKSTTLEEAKELHKAVRHTFKKRSIVTLGIDDLWAADLVILTAYEHENNGYKYLLNVIDTFSKFSWGVPLKKKNGLAVSKAFENIIQAAKKDKHSPPTFLHTDKGLEFENSAFKDVLKKYNIKMYHTQNTEKSAIVERFNRTINEKLKVKFQVQDNFKWVDLIPEIFHEYNHKDVHRTIGMRPAKVTSENEYIILQKYTKQPDKVMDHPTFKIGDRVRIKAFKGTFANKYKNNWTLEIFVVAEVLPTNPITYKIKDLNDEEIVGSFYKYELQKTNF